MSSSINDRSLSIIERIIYKYVIIGRVAHYRKRSVAFFEKKVVQRTMLQRITIELLKIDIAEGVSPERTLNLEAHPGTATPLCCDDQKWLDTRTTND